MITPFQPQKLNKPMAKAVHVFDETSDAKWVPLNKSFVTLVKIVLRAAADRLQVANIAITFRCITHQGYRHLLLAGEEQDRTISALGAVEEFTISNEPTISPGNEIASDDDAISAPIDYLGKRLGHLLATPGLHKTPSRSQIEQGLADVGRDVVSIIKRYQTRYRAIFIYGDQHYWIGSSSALRQLDQQIEKLESQTKPILIRGNKGTGKNIAARTLHRARHKSILPFIESSCHEWQEGAAMTILQSLYAYAKGGSLYLRNVDRLSEENMKALQQFWAETNAYLQPQGEAKEVGLMFSVSCHDYMAAPELKQWLAQHTCELILPDLTERREDIKDLVRFYVREFAATAEFDFSEEAWKLLQEFHWQHNVDQLKRVVQKIATVVKEPIVQVSMLESVLKD